MNLTCPFLQNALLLQNAFLPEIEIPRNSLLLPTWVHSREKSAMRAKCERNLSIHLGERERFVRWFQQSSLITATCGKRILVYVIETTVE